MDYLNGGILTLIVVLLGWMSVGLHSFRLESREQSEAIRKELKAEMWKLQEKMENKVDAEDLRDCKGECCKRLSGEVARLDHCKADKSEQEDLWKRVNSHRHDGDGRVVIVG